MKKLGLAIAGCLLIGVVVLVWMRGGKNSGVERSPAAKKGEAFKPAEPTPSVVTEPAGRPSRPASSGPAASARPKMTNSMPEVTFKAEKAEGIPVGLRTIFGQDEKKDYFTRIKAVHQLGKNLSELEIDALYLFLSRKNNEDNLNPGELDALKNEVSMAIMGQQKTPVNYANNLMAMYADSSHDDVWRDYCIQHLGQWYAKADASEQALIAKTFWNAAEKKQLPIAGTALIALSNNTGTPDISKQDVADKAYELCADAQCGELAKTTALQICAMLGDKRVLPIARNIAESGASVPLRMSAIASVGTLGDKTDKPMLEKYASSTDVRLRKSAQGALGRLK